MAIIGALIAVGITYAMSKTSPRSAPYAHLHET